MSKSTGVPCKQKLEVVGKMPGSGFDKGELEYMKESGKLANRRARKAYARWIRQGRPK